MKTTGVKFALEKNRCVCLQWEPRRMRTLLVHCSLCFDGGVLMKVLSVVE